MSGLIIIPEDTYLILCGGLYYTEDGEVSSLRRDAVELTEEELNDAVMKAAELGLPVETVRAYEESIERIAIKE